ncbi:MAG: porin family protein [Bacteroidales bacterium]
MKQIMIALLFMGAGLTLRGQTDIRLSVHADPQISWFSSDEAEVDPDGSRFHLQTGLTMDFFFAENYAFSAGFGLNNLGGSLAYADSTLFVSHEDSIYIMPGQTVKHKLQYLDFPVGLKLKTEELGYTTFFLELGFNPMININAKGTTEDGTLDDETISETTRLFNLGYHAGLGVEYRLGGNTAIIGGLRWTSGLTDVTENDKANIVVRSVSLHVGVLF